MRSAHVTTPKGVEWTVRAFRVRMPPWRSLDVGGDLTGTDFDLIGLVITAILLPFTLLLIPLVLAILELPAAIWRGLTSGTVWIEAASHWPAEERYLWRTTRADAPGVHAAVAAQLSAGHAPGPARAEFVEHSLPY